MSEHIYGPEAFAAATNVSRETLDRLTRYATLLTQWQARLNLVGKSTLGEVWRRHFLDSWQLSEHAPADAVWLDIGSGAGFPGLVLSLAGARKVHLVESDRRKCAFLRIVAAEIDAPVEVHNCRVEALERFPVDYVTSRACAPLVKLIEYAVPFFELGATGLFLKGQDVANELTEAAKYWTMDVAHNPSHTQCGATILRLEQVKRRVKNDVKHG